MTARTDEMFATKFPCHGCGYDLRAHSPDGTCPECGASVAEARRVAAIPRRPAWRESDARWRRRMLAGAWLLVLLPLMDLLRVIEWTSSVPVPAVFELGGNFRRLNDTLLSSMGVVSLYQMVVFCMGAVLLFSKERGRRSGPLDWTRRWGVLCSYVVSLFCAAQVLFIGALVLAGVAGVFQSMPLKYQPQVTPLFVNVSTAWLRYGLYPKDASVVVLVVFSSITMLLACIALFDALRSSGPKWLAVVVLMPLALFALMHLVQAGRYCLGFSDVTGLDLYLLAVCFRPEVLLNPIASQPAGWYGSGSETNAFIEEAGKWCSVLAIAGWLSVAQVMAWRRGKKSRAA